jgi:hypothetical protein
LVLRKELWDSGTARSVADLPGRKVAQNRISTGIQHYGQVSAASSIMASPRERGRSFVSLYTPPEGVDERIHR